MQIIKSIEIRNFRSIKNISKDFTVTDLNIFVGKNDNGKSNILRALNLFFNNETESGQPFRFDDNYCYHANSGTGTRREIRIDLIIHPPKGRFKNANPLRWTKKWKRDGSIVQERFYVGSNGGEVPTKDNISKWLDKLNYRYVPAIKGRDYFNSLMGSLHDVLSDAHNEVMENQGQGFISGIQEITDDITEELGRRIGIRNTIQVPSDFKLLFSNLDFGSTDGERIYHLKQRGDGIKVLHIPVILKYMAEQEKNISVPGFVKPDTIWGFEEPENNLEMRHSFELAESFRAYAKDIQIFVTTHSAAFYSLDKSDGDGITSFYVEKGADLCTTLTKVTHEENDELHDKMGLLPLITPYLNAVFEQQKKVVALQDSIDGLADKIKCCVITEDEIDTNLRVLLKANHFNLNQTEFFSYDGKDQIKGAIILGRYLLKKRPHVTVLVHRDRDYLSDEEIEKLRVSFTGAKINLFVTKGVDVESHFLSVEHLSSIEKDLDKADIEAFLESATNETEKKSVDRLIDHTLQKKKPENNGYAKLMHEIQESYKSDKIRYRYGKKVVGVFSGKAQKKLKKNFDAFQTSPALKDDFLLAVAALAWPR
jgi:energy-coupling factor transporter ATP-binding protein EcfA2